MKIRAGEKILVHAILIIACVLAVFPIVWILSTSFKPEPDVLQAEIHFIPEHPTLENYKYLLQGKDNIFLYWLGNSLLIAVWTTVIGVFGASTAAYAFSRFKFTGKKGLLFAFLITQMFPGAILIVPLHYIVSKLGLLNTYQGLIIAYCTISLPFCVWMLKSFFDTIPIELDEAARVDGLSTWGIFYRILLPLSLPGLAVTAFFSFITAWNEFMFALTFMTDERAYTLPVGLRTFVFQFNTDWHYMSAGAVLITLPVLAVFFWLQRYLISGLTTGGVKG